MLKGIHLTLMIGPAVPVPAPQSVMDAVQSVKVTSGKDNSGFELIFVVSKESPLLKTMLPAGYFDPMTTRVMIIVTLGGFPHVLMDGIVTRQELTPSNEPGQSTLTITGEDLSVLMDVVELPDVRYPGMTPVAQIYTILAKYAAFGIVPRAIPPIFTDIPYYMRKIPTHQGTDLAYLRETASYHGYVFYVEPGPMPGQSVAHWGPDIHSPVPQPALNVNMDAHTNVESLSFSLDGLAKKIIVYTILDPSSKVPIPIPLPNLNVLRPPLAARVTAPSKVEFAQGANRGPTEAVNEILGMLFSSSDSISVSGSLNVLRYGRVLHSRQLVGVRGAGIAYDGLYYVNSVTHTLQRGEYKQSFSLSRDGLIPLTPRVIP